MHLVNTVNISILLTSLVLGAEGRGEDVFTDDFSKEAPGRWETVWGAPWHVKDGEFFTTPKSGDYQKSIVVANFLMKEGVIEADVHSVADRPASIGLVAKYIESPGDTDIRLERCVFMRVAYWQLSIFNRWPPREEVVLGSFSLYDMDNREEPPERVHLKMVIRNGTIGLYVDGVLRTIFRDPYPDQEGRPGLFSESTTFATSFKARRTK